MSPLSSSSARTRVRKWTVAVCLFVLLVVTGAQAVHVCQSVQPESGDLSRPNPELASSLCRICHTHLAATVALPADLAPALLVAPGLPFLEPLVPSRLPVFFLEIRPPPMA